MFFYYKNKDNIELCIDEKSEKSIFDNKEIMESIFNFLKKNGHDKIVITLLKNKYIDRQKLAVYYGFKKGKTIKQLNNSFIVYEKKL